MDFANKVKDLEFQLRREKLESKTRSKETLCQILETQEGLEELLQTALKQNWPEEIKKFISERFTLTSKKLLQIVRRAGALQFNSLGQPVNEEYHEVVETVACKDVPPGQVTKVIREGYLYEGDLLRMAKVVITPPEVKK